MQHQYRFRCLNVGLPVMLQQIGFTKELENP